MMENLHKCHDYIARQTRRFFRASGVHIANKPYTTIVISLAVVFALMGCILLGKWEVRYEYRDALRASDGFKIYDEIILKKFGDIPREAEIIIELEDKNDNIIEKSNILKALDVSLQGRNLVVNEDSSEDDAIAFSDVCTRKYENGPCTIDSAFERLGLTYDDVVNMTQSEIDEKFVAGSSIPYLALNQVVGGLEVYDNGEVKGKSFRFMQFTSFPSDNSSRKISSLFKSEGNAGDSKKGDVLLWEARFLEYLCADKVDCVPRNDGLVITSSAERAVFDELDRNAQSSTMYMAAAVNLILIIMWFMIGGKPFRKSRLGLGVGALVTILLSMGAGFGLISLLQIPLTELSLLLVFVVVGIGVDDVIVVVDFVQRQKKDLPLVDRIANGLERAGPTIFLTSLTNLVAFFVASIIDYPGVRWFCAAAGVILFILFILTVTLFTAMLTLDERRMDSKRYDCLCCTSYVSKKKDEGRLDEESFSVQETQGRVTSLVHDMKKGYLKFISNKAFATLVVCGFLSLIPIGFGFAVQNLDVGAKFESYFPDGSYFIKFTDAVQANFASLESPAITIFQSIDVSDPTVQEQVNSLLSDLDEEEFILKPHTSWLADYEAYAYEHNNNTANSFKLPLSGEGYYEALESYLQITDIMCIKNKDSGECDRYVIPASYTNDIVFSRNSNGINGVAATRMNCIIEAYESSTDQIVFMEKHRETLTSSLKLYDSLDEENAMVWNAFYMFFDRDKEMNTLITKTLVFAALAVLGTLLFFLHPISVLVIAFAIASIDGALFTVMYIWGLPIDVVAFLVLAMSIGLSVDYVVHVAHAFEHEDGNPSERLQKALSGIGMSVAKGGVSTFLGIIALAFAPSAIFRTFFKLIFSTVVLGIFAGLVFFPACTALIGRFIRPKRQGSSV